MTPKHPTPQDPPASNFSLSATKKEGQVTPRMASRTLQVVTEDTPKPPATPKNIKESLDMGERAVLVALRAQAARELDSGKVPAHAMAGLMKQLRDLDREIRALDLRAREDAASRGAEVEDGHFDANAV